jgi:hypothetical protein
MPQDTYSPTEEQKKATEKLQERITYLKDARKQNLPGSTHSIEDIWSEVDVEFTPHELSFMNTNKRRFETDQSDGLRSRLVKLGEDENWQSNISSSDFYVKVATAVSVLIDMNPEAVFEAASRKHEKSQLVAYTLWKQSWEVSLARQQMKLYAFNDAKYGFAVGKTYPRIIEQTKNGKRLVKYNDLCRKSFNPWSVWISDTARLGDPYSVNDWYHEVEYDEDGFKQDFTEAEYPEAKFVKPGMYVSYDKGPSADSDKKTNKITVGFYENQVTDKYQVIIPSAGILLYDGALPNDDAMLSLWFSPWTLRDDRSIYGIGIYEIIRNDKVLYDKLSNMTMDQLVLSIYKMFFYKSVETMGENGKMVVTPGGGEPMMDPASISWMNVPGPGPEAWKGMEWQKSLIDENSGVPMQLSGKFGGRTLGQDMQAKETALERLKTPLDFICDALQEEAYLSLSWMKQIYSTPEVLEFVDREDLAASLEEMGMDKEDIATYLQEFDDPRTNGTLMYQTPGETDTETGEVTPGKNRANVYKEIPARLKKGDRDELIESDDRRFFRFGLDLDMGHLDFRGIIRINPQSILRPSKELSKRNDLDLFNLVFPSIQAMAANPSLVPALMPPIKQIIAAYDKDPKDWIDMQYFAGLQSAANQPKDVPPEVKTSLSISLKDILPGMDEAQSQVLEKYLGIKVEPPMFVDAVSGAGNTVASSTGPAATAGGEQTVAPNAKEGISPVADMKSAPTTLGGAIEGATNMV